LGFWGVGGGWPGGVLLFSFFFFFGGGGVGFFFIFWGWGFLGGLVFFGFFFFGGGGGFFVFVFGGWVGVGGLLFFFFFFFFVRFVVVVFSPPYGYRLFVFWSLVSSFLPRRTMLLLGALLFPPPLPNLPVSHVSGPIFFFTCVPRQRMFSPSL